MSRKFAFASAISLPLGGTSDRLDRFPPWRPPITVSGRGGAGNVHTTIIPNLEDSANDRNTMTSSSATTSSASDSADGYSFLTLRKSRSRFLTLPRTGNTKPRSKSCPRKPAPSGFGRGGAGNRRDRKAGNTSNNRLSPLPDINQLEQQYLLAREAWRPHQPQSSGRGGAGNISLPRPVARAVQILVSVTKR